MPGIFFPSSKPRFVNEKEVVSELKQLALKIAKKNKKVRSIYLFGSYVEGNAGVYSDADILVVLFQDNREIMDRLDEFLLEFADACVPVDVLVYTEAELRQAIDKQGNRFLSRAVKGIKLAG